MRRRPKPREVVSWLKWNDLDKVAWSIVDKKFPRGVLLKLLEIEVAVSLWMRIIEQSESIPLFCDTSFGDDEIMRSDLSEINMSRAEAAANKKSTDRIAV